MYLSSTECGTVLTLAGGLDFPTTPEVRETFQLPILAKAGTQGLSGRSCDR